MTLIRYEVRMINGLVTERTFDRETECYYFYRDGRRERRVPKSDRYATYFVTRADADACAERIRQRRAAENMRRRERDHATGMIAAIRAAILLIEAGKATDALDNLRRIDELVTNGA